MIFRINLVYLQKLCRRPEDDSPLDLNNVPDDHSRQACRAFEEGSSSSGSRVRGNKNGKEYECRFCSLKFCKSQALGGHMNRHRQERETESLNKARELVLRNDSFPPQGPSPFCRYHPASGTHIGEGPMYPPWPFSAATSSSGLPGAPPLPPPYLYPPPPPSPPSHYHPYHSNEYYLGHSGAGGAELPFCARHQTLNYSATVPPPPPPLQSYTFIGAPVSHGRGPPPRPPNHGL